MESYPIDNLHIYTTWEEARRFHEWLKDQNCVVKNYERSTGDTEIITEVKASLLLRFPESDKTPREEFEYLVIQDVSPHPNQLRVVGQVGWELVSVAQGPTYFSFFFKRRIEARHELDKKT